MKQFQIIQEASIAKEDENRFTCLVKQPIYGTH